MVGPELDWLKLQRSIMEFRIGNLDAWEHLIKLLKIDDIETLRRPRRAWFFENRWENAAFFRALKRETGCTERDFFRLTDRARAAVLSEAVAIVGRMRSGDCSDLHKLRDFYSKYGFQFDWTDFGLKGEEEIEELCHRQLVTELKQRVVQSIKLWREQPKLLVENYIIFRGLVQDIRRGQCDQSFSLEEIDLTEEELVFLETRLPVWEMLWRCRCTFSRKPRSIGELKSNKSNLEEFKKRLAERQLTLTDIGSSEAEIRGFEHRQMMAASGSLCRRLCRLIVNLKKIRAELQTAFEDGLRVEELGLKPEEFLFLGIELPPAPDA